MWYIVHIFSVIFLSAVELSLLASVAPLHRLPNLLFLYTIVLACQDEDGVYLFGFLGGLYTDFLTGAPLGVFTAAFLLSIFFIRVVFTKFIFSEKPARYLVVLVAVGTVILSLWVFSFEWVLLALKVPLRSGWADLHVFEIIWQVIAGIICLYPLYAMHQFIWGRLEKFKQRKLFV